MEENQRRIRLVTVDMDGTLLNERGKISDRTLQTIRAAQDAGIVFSICTGRFFENASILLKDYGLDCPLIALNGAKVALRPYGACLVKHKMPLASAKATFDLLERTSAGYFLFGDGLVVIRRDGDVHHSQIDFGERMETEANTRYEYGKEACLRAIGEGIYKFYIHFGDDLQALGKLRDRLRDVPDINLTQSSNINIEVMPLGIDKGQGLRELAGHLVIPMTQVMAVGDEDNDLPMLRAAGLGVAMGNATQAVKGAADVITLSNAEDGVSVAIERYALASVSGQPK
ncbi:MAG: Cof-type HAD-IIB family hydrolase [Christensenellales bacterium]